VDVPSHPEIVVNDQYMAGLAALLVVLLCVCSPVQARGTYQTPEAFLQEVFSGPPPTPETLWLKGDVKDQVTAILGHRYSALRIRYWGRDRRTAWILEETGKDQPITTGLVVNDGKLETIRVLIFRESRGWEVRHPFFTEQFNGAGLTDEQQLDRNIDGISGATLSVRALEKLARLALYLHTRTAYADDTP
jgi:hypothetical protein